MTGQQILDQQIREQIIFKAYPNLWWTYMEQFDQECEGNASQFKECGNAIMYKLGIDAEHVQSEF